MDAGNLGSVIGVTTQVIVINDDGSTYVPIADDKGTKEKDEDKTGLIVGIVVAVLGSIAIAIGIYFIVQKFKGRQEVVPEKDPNVSSQKIHPNIS